MIKITSDKVHLDSMFSNAIMLHRGEGISENKIEVSQNYKMAVRKCYALSMKNHGIILKTGNGVLVNKEKAVKYRKTVVDLK